MDIREFSNKLAEAAKTMSPEEKASLMKMFEAVSDEITKVGADQTGKASQGAAADRIVTEGTSIPDGMTARLQALKDNYLTHKPTITTHRARAITKIAGENPGMPKIMLRAKTVAQAALSSVTVDEKASTASLLRTTLKAYRETLISSNLGISDEEYRRFIILAEACKTFDCYGDPRTACPRSSCSGRN